MEQRRRSRRYAGQVFVLLDAAGQGGFLESATAQAELAYDGGFVYSASYLGRFGIGDDVTFSAAHRLVGSNPPGGSVRIPSLHLGYH